MELLLTSSRLPFALEEIRKLGRRGHTVLASDTFRASPGNHSRYAAAGFVTASPTYDPGAFVDDVERIVRERRVDRIVPAFEEVFYLARHRDRLERHAQVFAPPFETLHLLHDKVRFLELASELGHPVLPTLVARDREELARATREFPRFFARPAYGRAGITIFTNAGPRAGQLALEECEPSALNPFLVQPFVEGVDECTFAVAHAGRVTACATYVHPLTIESAGGIAFESIDAPDDVAVTRSIAEATRYEGQISIDLMRTRRGLVVVECNPRPSAGLIVMPDEMLDDAIVDRHPGRTWIAPAGSRAKLSLALLRNVVVHRQAARSFAALLSRVPDVYVDPGDLVPLFFQLLGYGRVLRFRLRERRVRARRTDLMEAYLDDIRWDGEPIVPPVPPSPHAALPLSAL